MRAAPQVEPTRSCLRSLPVGPVAIRAMESSRAYPDSRKNGWQMMQRLRRTRSALLVRRYQRLKRRRKEVRSARNSSRSSAHLRSRTGAAPLRRLRMLGRHSRTLTTSCFIRTTACMRSSGLPRTSMVGTAIVVPLSDLAEWPLKREALRERRSHLSCFERMRHTSNMRQRLRRDIELIWIKSMIAVASPALTRNGVGAARAVLTRKPNRVRAFPSLKSSSGAAV